MPHKISSGSQQYTNADTAQFARDMSGSIRKASCASEINVRGRSWRPVWAVVACPYQGVALHQVLTPSPERIHNTRPRARHHSKSLQITQTCKHTLPVHTPQEGRSLAMLTDVRFHALLLSYTLNELYSMPENLLNTLSTKCLLSNRLAIMLNLWQWKVFTLAWQVQNEVLIRKNSKWSIN